MTGHVVTTVTHTISTVVTCAAVRCSPSDLFEDHPGLAAWLSAGGGFLAVSATVIQTVLANRSTRRAERRQAAAEETARIQRALAVDAALEVADVQMGVVWRSLDALIEDLAHQLALPNSGDFEGHLQAARDNASLRVYVDAVGALDVGGLPAMAVTAVADGKAALSQFMVELAEEAENKMASLVGSTILAVMRDRLRRLDLAIGALRVERARIALENRLHAKRAPDVGQTQV